MTYHSFQKYLFGLFALSLIGAAFHHLYEYFVPQLRPDYPPVRHIAFFAINFLLAFLMVKRTKYFLPLLFLIAIQQLYGHGGKLLSGWSGGEVALYIDWIVVILMPLVLITYSYDVFRKTS